MIFGGFFHAPAPRKQLFEPVSWVSLCHAVDDVGEIGFWIEAVELCGFEDGVDDGDAVATSLGAEEQIVFSGDGDAAQGALRRVIVNADAAISGVEAQSFPAAERVV